MTQLYSATNIGNGTTKLSGGQELKNIHAADDCFGAVCPLHNPSEHEWRDMPLFFNGVNMFRKLPDNSSVIDPDDYAYNQTGSAILLNAAKCLSCGEVAISESRYDFTSCYCEKVFADGGHTYIRHGYQNINDYEDLSVIFTKE